MTSGESAVVLLRSQVDWPRWLAVAQTKANHNRVWDYIKPTLKKDEVRRELHEPSFPAVTDFSTAPDATAAFSTATRQGPTLQGKEAESQGKTEQKQMCFEGYGKHPLDRCFYLRKELR